MTQSNNDRILKTDYDKMNKGHPILVESPCFTRLIEAAKPSPDWRCLDMGSGSGANSTLILAAHAKEVVGIDIDSATLKKAKRSVVKYGSKNKVHLARAQKVKLELGNAEALDFNDESFDLVNSRGGIRHCVNWVQGFMECVRVLKPGGCLLLGELALPSTLIDLWHSIDGALGRHEYYWEYPHLMGHILAAGLMVELIIPEFADRMLDVFLESIPDDDHRRACRNSVLTLPDAMKEAIGLHEELDDGKRVAVFTYQFLNILLRKPDRRDSEVNEIPRPSWISGWRAHIYTTSAGQGRRPGVRRTN